MTPRERPQTNIIRGDTQGKSQNIYWGQRYNAFNIEGNITEIYMKFLLLGSVNPGNILVYTVEARTVFLMSDNTQPPVMDDRIPKEVPT